MKVGLTGVTGHLGAAVLRELLHRDYEVKVLSRRIVDRSFARMPVEIVQGDILNKETLAQFASDCEAIIHCAALISINGDRDGMVHRTNVEGTAHLMEAAHHAGVKRFVHVSSIHVYQQEPIDAILNEERVLVGDNAYAYDVSKRRSQESALSWNRDGMEVLIIQPTALLGPFDFKPSRAGGALISMLKGRLPFLTQGGFDFCDCRDVSHAVVNALQMGTPGEAYILSGRWTSMQEISSILRTVTGRKRIVVTIPTVVAQMGLPLIRGLSRLANREPLYTRESLDALLTGNKKIKCAKAVHSLEYANRPLEETLADVHAWFRDEGYLR